MLILFATGLMLCGVAAPLAMITQDIAYGAVSMVIGIIMLLVSAVALSGYRI